MEGTFIPNPLLVPRAKALLKSHATTMLNLSKWYTFFELLPSSVVADEKVFTAMLVNCKITKFRDVNFKILSRILLTPKLLATMKKEEILSVCVWCGDVASLEHILFLRSGTKALCCFILTRLFKNLHPHQWIFGSETRHLDLVLWLANFTIYKAHLLAVHLQICSLHDLFLNMCLL